MNDLNLLQDKSGFIGPSFSLKNRLMRLLWILTWIALARWTPPAFHNWRIFLVNLFGGKVSYKSYIYPNVRIWAPWNLYMHDYATLARGVECYNIAKITLKEKSIVSQDAKLYTGTHNYSVVDFPLIAKPIYISKHAWIAASCFVGPGVILEEGAILGACGVTFKNLDAWSIYIGNPAQKIKDRTILKDE